MKIPHVFKRRLIDDSTVSSSTGPISLDVEFARKIGWDSEDCTEIGAAIHMLSIGKQQEVALRKGRTLICKWCQCFVPPTGCDLGC